MFVQLYVIFLRGWFLANTHELNFKSFIFLIKTKASYLIKIFTGKPVIKNLFKAERNGGKLIKFC